MTTATLPTPAELHALSPLKPDTAKFIAVRRQAIADVLAGKDRRKLAVIGPCSLDETDAAYELWQELQPVAEAVSEKLITVIRAPIAKPRTIGGWRGLEQDDPGLARKQLVRLAHAGASVAIELLEPHHTVFYGDVLSLGWVGARTVATPNLRLEVSRYVGLPVLFKNGVEGSLQLAAEARAAALMQHENVPFLHDDGRLHVTPLTAGNPATLTALRGSMSGGRAVSNADLNAVRESAALSEKCGLSNRGVVIDVSHANGAAETNGKKSAAGQQKAFGKVLSIIRQDSEQMVRGVMIEALLREGVGDGYGMSRTDPTVDVETAKSMLQALAEVS